MKRVEIATGFTGYPGGKKRHFAQGETPMLADAFANLIIGKGLGQAMPDTPATPEPPGGGEEVTSHENIQPED